MNVEGSGKQRGEEDEKKTDLCVRTGYIYGYNRGRTAAGLCRQTSKTTEHDVRMLRQ